MFLKTIRSMRMRDWILLVAISLCVAFGGVFGWSYGTSESKGSSSIDPLICFILSLVLTVVVGAIVLACNAGLTKLAYRSLNRDAAQDDQQEGAAPSVLSRLVPQLTLKSVVAFSVIIILFWSPYLVAAFPGTMYNDTAIQMQQVYEEAHPLDLRSGGNFKLDEGAAEKEYGNLADQVKRSERFYVTDAWLVDHHPFALTLIYGGIAKASDALFGNWIPGFAALMMFQVIVLAAELAFAVAFLRARGAPLSLCLAALVFFCIVPAVPLASVLIMKDTAFTLCFIPYFLMLCAQVMNPGALFQRKRNVALFVVLALLMCLMKKTGLYVVGATALVGLGVSLARMRAQRSSVEAVSTDPAKASAAAFFLQGALSALLMFALVPFVVFPALNVTAGSKGEAIGFMFQQTARVYRDYGPDALTPEEKQAVSGVLYTSGLEWDYMPTLVDRVKIRYDLESTNEELMAYLKAYASMALRFPAAYLESFISLDAGYLSPVVPYQVIVNNAGWSLDFDDGRQVLPLDEDETGYQQAITAFVSGWDSIPVLDLLLRGVTYCLWVPAILLFFCMRNRLKAGLLFMPFAMVTFFCLIGPIYDMRYLMPEIMLAPVLLGAVVAQAKRVFKARADEARAIADQA